MKFPAKASLDKTFSIIAAHFIMVPVVVYFDFGNLAAYLESYTRFFTGDDEGSRAYTEWIIALLACMESIGFILTHYLARRLSLKLLSVLCTVVCAASLTLSAWALKSCALANIILLGAIPGTCSGMGMCLGFLLVERWTPERYGLLSSCAYSFPNLVALVLNQLITLYVNPDNLSPDTNIGQNTYFSQSSLLKRVPGAILLMAAIIAGFQVLACLLMKSSPDTHRVFNIEQKETSKLQCEADSESCKILQSQNISEVLYCDNCDDAFTSGDVCGKNTMKTGHTDTRSGASLVTLHDDQIKPLESNSKAKSWKVSESLCTPVFWAIWTTNTMIITITFLLNNYYKIFGLVYIPDDKFFSLVGTLMSVVAPVFKVIYGWFLNKGIFRIKDVFITVLSFNTILCGVWYLSARLDQIFYLIVIVTLNGFHNVHFITVPIAAMRFFGRDHFSNNVGAMYSGNILAAVLFPVAMKSILVIGWLGIFSFSAFLSLLTLILVLFIKFGETE